VAIFINKAVRRLVSDAITGALDLVYPPQCVVCGTLDAAYLCEECYSEILRIEPPICRACGIPCEEFRCRQCHDARRGFDYARSAGVFDGVLREAIHAMKYRGSRMLVGPISRLMIEQWNALRLPRSIDVVIPIPVDPSRMVDRGFNQAADLAMELCKATGMHFDDSILCRPRRTAHQVEVSYEERLTNLGGAFSVTNPSAVVRKRVLLVDDVFTTGSTLSEAAQTLKTAGAAAVICYTCARSL